MNGMEPGKTKVGDRVTYCSAKRNAASSHAAGRRVVFEKQVGNFDRPRRRLEDIGGDLRFEAGPLLDEDLREYAPLPGHPSPPARRE